MDRKDQTITELQQLVDTLPKRVAELELQLAGVAVGQGEKGFVHVVEGAVE